MTNPYRAYGSIPEYREHQELKRDAHPETEEVLGEFSFQRFGLALSPAIEAPALKFIPELIKSVDEGKIPESEVAKIVYERFPLYSSTRAHEKAHWYQVISCSLLQARLFSYGDRTRYTLQALESIPKGVSLRFPLAHWAYEADCPEGIKEANAIYEMSWLSDLVADGRFPLRHREIIDHVYGGFFNDLGPDPWHSPQYRMGIITLCEGSATAAELMYPLKKGYMTSDHAEKNIYSRPPVYSRAYDYLTSVVVGARSVLARLQTLAVCADIALHPEVPSRSWPWIGGMILDAPPQDILPGYRFVKLLSLLKNETSIDFESKEDIAAFLDQQFIKIGWPSMNRATEQSLNLIQRAQAGVVAAGAPAALVGSGISIGILEEAMKLRLQEMRLYVPPVNAELIDSSNTQCKGFLGSEIDPPSDFSVKLSFLMWKEAVIADTVMRLYGPICPLANSASSGSLFKREILSECRRASEGLCDSATRDSEQSNMDFLNCTLVDKYLRPRLGDDWQRRAVCIKAPRGLYQ